MNARTEKYVRDNVIAGSGGGLTGDEIDAVVGRVLVRVARREVSKLGYYARRAGLYARLDKVRNLRIARRKLVREKEKARAVERARVEARMLVQALDRAVDKVLAADLPETQREAILDKIAGIPYEVMPAPTHNTAHQWCCRAIRKVAPALSPDELAAIKTHPSVIRHAREVCRA